MAEIIIMPKLGFNMDAGELVAWHKKVGDQVKKGEILFEINTDKTTMPIEATHDGVLLKVMLQEYETAEVFSPIAVVGQQGEAADKALEDYLKKNGMAGSVTAQVVEEAAAPAEAVAAVADIDAKDLKLTPKAKKYIKDNGIDIATVARITGTGYEGGITAKDIAASPLAKKLAEKNHVDLSGVEGSGVNGKIMKKDVENAVNQAPVSTDGNKKILSEVPYSGIRKVIGDRLSQSKFTAPHLYFTDEVDTTSLTKFRKELNGTCEEKVSVSDLLVLAASKALQKYPSVNCSLIDNKIITYKSTNIGIAVAGDKGLIVPVVKDAQEKSLTAIAKETKDLIARAREGKLLGEEYTGGTFSISNLGMFGIDNFTAIINPPEAAILSVSSVKKKPVVVEENGEDVIVARPVMNIQLSVDHRLIDGLLAAQFVGYMKELLENPIKILL